MTDIIKDFMGIFPNAASKEYCDKVINRFDYLQETGGEGRGIIRSRKEEGALPRDKENDTYFLGGTEGDHLPLEKKDIVLMNKDMSLLQEFNEITWNCYEKFAEKYGELKSIALHKISSSIRIQKYKPSQGYHVWHSEAGNMISSSRMLVVTLYLNTVEEGGETEFLSQSMRISPVQGTLLLHPAGWTHTHRGNPPLKGNKYILTTWLEFVE
jgi:hypothetical protein